MLALLAGACAADVGSEVGATEGALISRGTRFGGGTLPVLEPGEGIPRAPAQVAIVDRQTASITIRWHDASEVEASYEIWRHGEGEPLAQIATLPAEDGGFPTFADSGLEPDTAYCYQVRARNAEGVSYSSPTCAYTRAEDDIPVWRAQVRITTADLPTALTVDPRDGGTVDAVSVRLNSPPWAGYAPSGHVSWLDYGGRDFEDGQTRTWDVALNTIDQQHDITLLQLEKAPGHDPVCIEDLRLLVNIRDQVLDDATEGVFHRHFGDTEDTCLWLTDEHPTFTITHEELRADPNWHSAGYGRPPVFTRTEIEATIATIVANLLADIPEAHWGALQGDRYVEATRRSNDTLSIDLDLEGDAPIDDPDIDLDFDLVFSADHEAVVITAVNLVASVEFSWLTEVLGALLPCGPIVSVIEDEGIPDCVAYLEDYIAERIQASWAPIRISIDPTQPICGPGLVPQPSVTELGDVQIDCVAEPPIVLDRPELTPAIRLFARRG
ncbi:MAG: hypothetical protein H6719_31120 [Sandaracinaceae bacterium]|nr:hypothetical protein [Sandaracinaceae bacterium]